MKFLRQFKRDAATFAETLNGGAKIQLFTPTRGPREFTTSLTIDEIEDLIKSEESRRATFKLTPAEQSLLASTNGTEYTVVRILPSGGMATTGDSFPTYEDAETCAEHWRATSTGDRFEVRRAIPL